MIELQDLTPGGGLRDCIEDIARLRIAVFRDWPYLYDGDFDYERGYLSRFAASDGALCVAAYDGVRMVGASTAMPLAQEHAAITAPFVSAGYDLDRIFYCAETVLLPAYRGRKLYRQFFERREGYARLLSVYDTVVFCGVVRPADHPLRPADDRPLDDIWRRFGYTPQDDLICHFSWKDIDREAATEKPMRFWMKPLEPVHGHR